MTETQKNPLAESFNALSLIRFAFPSMVMMLFMGLYTIVDTIFVARFVDTNALSSINIVCPVINLIVGLGTMLATGGSAVVAKKMGNGNTEEARRNFTLIVVAGAVIGLLITAAGLLFLDEIIWGLGASEILFPYCRDYLTIQLIFAAFNMMQVLYQNLFVTAGKPTLGLVLAVLAGIANIVFDYVFIVLLQMGIKGAAIGTGIGYMIPTIIGTIFFLMCRSMRKRLPVAGSVAKRSELHFCKPDMDASVLLKSCSNGASEMVSQCSTAVTTFLFNVTMMKLLGEDGVAAITVIIYSQFLLTTLYIGFSMGTAPVVSYNYGSGNVKQLKKTVRICFSFISGISIFVFLFSLFGGESIAKVFAENNRNVFEITKNGFVIFSFSFLFSGCNIFSSALFTALSNGKASATISFLRTFGFIMVSLLVLPRFLEVTGVWLAVPFAELFTLMLTVYLLCRHWKQYHYF
ncbi:MATE family efflux transporter [Anaerotruncus sp. 1XD22-93]|nr:MATE family efflux transporter [Lachnospiraceae bacterium]NBI76177.1 MATE family efflux transporter [Lachnospiraceae bacterium]RKJ83462.1 MATE family efflux transporter [Anaerotruncus sp. 1XD22-93]